MGLVLTVDKDMVLSLNESIYIEFFECQKGRTIFSVLNTKDGIELEGFISNEKDYKFLGENDEIISISLMDKKAKGKERTRINIEAPKDVRILRVNQEHIPDIEYEFISLKRQEKRKTLFKKDVNHTLPDSNIIEKEDDLINRYKNELSWFFN